MTIPILYPKDWKNAVSSEYIKDATIKAPKNTSQNMGTNRKKNSVNELLIRLGVVICCLFFHPFYDNNAELIKPVQRK